MLQLQPFSSGSVLNGAGERLVSILCTKALHRSEDSYSVPTPQLSCFQAKWHYFLPPFSDNFVRELGSGVREGVQARKKKINTNMQSKGL